MEKVFKELEKLKAIIEEDKQIEALTKFLEKQDQKTITYNDIVEAGFQKIYDKLINKKGI